MLLASQFTIFSVIAIFMAMISAILFASSVGAANPFRFSLQMDTPVGLGTITATSPRRIELSIALSFRRSTRYPMPTSVTATIGLTAANEIKAQSARVRTKSWKGVGTWDTTSYILNFTFYSPIDSYATTQAKAFAALQNLEIEIPEVEQARAKITGSKVIVRFKKMAVATIIDTTASFSNYLTNCRNSGTGRFVLDFLRDYEWNYVVAQLGTANQYWVGAYLAWGAGVGGFYCYVYGLDYVATECKTNGAYTSYGVDSAGTVSCSQPVGWACATAGTFGTSAANSYYRFVHSSVWSVNDQQVATITPRSQVCCELVNALEINGVSHQLVVNRTQTRSFTKSPSPTSVLSESISISGDESKSISPSAFISVSSSSTPSISDPSSTPSANDSATSSTSRSKRTSSTTLTTTITRSHPPTRTATNSKTTTKSFTKTKPLTKTKSHTKTVSPSISEIVTISDTSTNSFSALSGTNFDSSSHSKSLERSNSSSFVASLTSTLHATRSRPMTKSVTFPRPPKAHPIPALENVQAFAIIASIAGGASVVAVARARLQSALQLAACGTGSGLTGAMDTLDNPLGLSFGSGILQSQRGAAFGNFYIIVIFGIVMSIAAFALSRYNGLTFWNAMQRVRMPGILILVLQIITPGTAQATASLWQYPQMANDVTLSIFASVTIVFGPLILVLMVTLPEMCKAVLYPLPPRHHDDDKKQQNNNNNNSEGEIINQNGSDDEDSSSSSQSGFGKHVPACVKTIWRKMVYIYSFIVLPTEDWFDQDVPPPTEPRPYSSIRGDESVRGKGGFVMKYGVIFEDFDRPMFGFFDLIVSTVLGATAGFGVGYLTRPTCLLLLTVATLFCAGHLLYLLYRRPCLTRIMQSYMAANSLFTFLTVFLSLLVFLGETLNFDDFAQTILNIQTIVSLFTAMFQILALFVFFYEAYDAFKHGKYSQNDDNNNSASRQNATFHLEDLLLMEGEDRENIQIDLTDFLNGEDIAAVNDDDDDDNNEGDGEEIDMNELWVEDDEAEDEELMEIQFDDDEGNNNEETYELLDDDGNALNLDDDDENLEILFDEHGIPIGSAARANAEQHAELTSMLSHSNIKHSKPKKKSLVKNNSEC